MGITKWKNLPALDVVTKALVFHTPCDETFEMRMEFAQQVLEYTKSEIDAIRTRRSNYLKMQGRDRRVFL
tara:strand:- start:42 stop:251 length:210 start_codon:yes stop_codon:yes gene_type:complete